MTQPSVPRRLAPGSAPLSRRGFLLAAAGGIAAAALIAGGMPAAPAHADSAELASRLKALDQPSFARYHGELFHFSVPSAAPVQLELTEVEDRSAHGVAGGDCFAVIFRGPRDRPLGQGTYAVWNQRSGAFSLFIVPLRPDGDSQSYAALFNRLPA